MKTFKEFLTVAPKSFDYKIVKMTNAHLEEAVDVAASVFRAELGIDRESFFRICNNACRGDIPKLSYMCIVEDKIVGGYFLGPRQLCDVLNNECADNLRDKIGVEGVALFLKREYRNRGIGQSIRAVPEKLDVDYVWGGQEAALNNLDKWLNHGRVHAATVGNIHYTYQMLK